MIQKIKWPFNSVNHNKFLSKNFLNLCLFFNIFEINNKDFPRKIFKPSFKLNIMRKGRKISGGKYKKQRKKKKYEQPGEKRIVKLKAVKKKTLRTLGGNVKMVLLGSNEINILDKKTGKAKKVKIKNVLETPSNRFLARQNVITKGAIVETDLGKARITNRPSQEGAIQGILIE